ncbi:hypothetical protein F4677DRAFT_465450 [Hypoxylon crocopeplum]|nr:hypothetical protein F4677DRAFT_465450 [Hypoxylon crocopeplum]
MTSSTTSTSIASAIDSTTNSPSDSNTIASSRPSTILSATPKVTSAPNSLANSTTGSTTGSSAILSNTSIVVSASGSSAESTTDSTISSNSESSSTPRSSTDLPLFIIPTGTLTSGPEETYEAAKVAPILLFLWQGRSTLQDEEHKQEYIDDVKKSRDDIVGLFNQYSNKGTSKSECKQTSVTKRSLISSIIDTFTSVVELISCAVDVLDNLVDAVTNIKPPITVVELLTNTLQDIGNELKKKQEEESEPTSASSPSLSCTETITKTWESVLCTVTASSAKQRRQDCTTEVYSTVAGCSVVGSTVTKTTTTTPGAEPTLLCGFGECDGSSCQQDSKELTKRRPRRLSQPNPNDWAGPEHYGGNHQSFMAGEVASAYDNANFHNQGVILAKGTTSQFIPFAGTPGSLAVAGLYGCTSLIAISKRGAWVSHMWEIPSFTSSKNTFPPIDVATQAETFRKEVLEAIKEGNTANHAYGLKEMTSDNPNPLKPTSYLMNKDGDPRFFLFTPYARETVPWLSNYNNEFPVGLPLAWNQEELTTPYATFNERIEFAIWDMFGISASYEEVPYAPRLKRSDNEDVRDKNFDSHRGKVLVQYQPAKNCYGKASWRVWFEGHEMKPSHQSEWGPLGGLQVSGYQPNSSGSPLSATSPADPSDTEVPTESAGVPSTLKSSSNAPTPSSTTGSSISTTPSQSPRSTTAPADPSDTETTTSSNQVSSTLKSSSIIPTPSSTTGSSISTTSSSTRTGPVSTTGVSSTSTTKASSSTIISSSISTTTSSSTSITPSSTISSTTTRSSSTSSSSSTSTTTTSSSKTEPPPPPPTPTTSLEFKDTACHDAADFPGHGDISSDSQGNYCNDFENMDGPNDSVDMSPDSPPLTLKRSDLHGINYEFTVVWVSGCVTVGATQNFKYPFFGDGKRLTPSASTIVRGVYMDCNNGGVGGKRQAGCLEYTFTGGK